MICGMRESFNGGECKKKVGKEGWKRRMESLEGRRHGVKVEVSLLVLGFGFGVLNSVDRCRDQITNHNMSNPMGCGTAMYKSFHITNIHWTEVADHRYSGSPVRICW
jgi:hypothetical protein